MAATLRKDAMRAVIVGSGPNGLVAAIELARGGLEVTVLEAKPTIGGGTRTEELTRPGFLHDVCAAFHPLGVVSPALNSMPLADHGLEWILPEVQFAHPLDDGSAGAAWLSLDRTAEHLGRDGRRWRRLVSPIVNHWDSLSTVLLGPVARRPERAADLLKLTRMALPSTVAIRGLSERAAALFTGSAAHSMQRLTAPLTTGVGIVLSGLAHVGGWPLARGGTASVSTALASYASSLGVQFQTEHPVGNIGDLPEHDIVMFNTTPATLEDVYGSRAPASMRRWVRRFVHGVGSYKIDYALSEPIPWTAEACRVAGTVHVGGTASEIRRAEAEVMNGTNPDRPFVLVGQQSLFDSSRAPAGQHTAWAYTHVPLGFRGSVAAQIESQVERFAPGFRDVILARNIMSPTDLEAHNPNYVGGDIAAGAMSVRQTVARPRFGPNPYRTEIPGVYLCSASTPPGPGVHGMAGFHAAAAALSDLAHRTA